MSNPEKLKQLSQKFDTLTKTLSVISDMSKAFVDSGNVTNADINNLEMQLGLLEEMVATLDEISFEMRSMIRVGRMMLGMAKADRDSTDEGDEDDE